MRPLIKPVTLFLLLAIALAGCGPLSPMGWWKFQDGIAQTTPFNDGVTQTTPLVSGQVFQASGAPAAGVLVKAYASDVRATADLPKPMEVHTDAAGRYRLADLPHGLHTIEAEASEQSKAIHLRVAVAPGDEIKVDPLILQPTGTLVGRVATDGPSELLGTMVFIPGTRYLALTDQHGAFTMTHVPAGTYELAAMRPSFATTVVTGVAIKSAETVQAPPITLTLDAPVLSSLSRSNGGPDTEVTLRGQNFGDPKRTQILVTFGDVLVTTLTHVSDTEIRLRVPEKARSGPVIVRSDGVESNALPFQVIAVLKVSPYYAAMYVGDHQQFQVEARDAYGQLIPEPDFTWQLGSPLLGSLEANGELRTRDAGWSEVRATSGAAAGIATVGVTPFATRVAGMHENALAGAAGHVVAQPDGLRFTHRAGHRIYACDMQGNMRPLAGTGVKGFSPDGTPALQANLNLPEGLAFDDAGNLYFTERGNHLVRVIPHADVHFGGRRLEAGKIYTLAGMIDLQAGGAKTGAGLSGFNGDGPGTQVKLATPTALEVANGGVLQGGQLLVTDWGNRRLRELDAAGSLTTLLGGGAATEDGVAAPQYAGAIGYQLARDQAGNLVFAEGHRLRFFCRASGTYYGRAMQAGHVYVVAGSSEFGFDGDGPATSVRLWAPRGMIFDEAGNLYFAEEGNGSIRILTASGLVRLVGGVKLPRDFTQAPTTTEVAPATSVQLTPYALTHRDGTIIVGDGLQLQFYFFKPFGR